MDSSVLYSSNHRRRGYPKPERERHPISAVMSLAGVICLIIALAEPRWSRRGSTECHATSTKVCVTNLGLFHNDFRVKPFNLNSENKYLVASTVFCCLLASVWLLLAFILSLGYPRSRLSCLRHNAIGNILGVLCSVMGCSLWFWCTSNLSRTNGYEELHFDVSFYLVVAAAACAVVAGAINLLRFKPYHQSQRTGLNGSISGSETAMMNLLGENDDNIQNATLPSYQP